MFSLLKGGPTHGRRWQQLGLKEKMIRKGPNGNSWRGIPKGQKSPSEKLFNYGFLGYGGKREEAQESSGGGVREGFKEHILITIQISTLRREGFATTLMGGQRKKRGRN